MEEKTNADELSWLRRQAAIEFFDDLAKEAKSCADQLRSGEEHLFTTNAHIVSAAAELWYEFKAGKNPRTGELMFELYMPLWAKNKK